MSQEVADTTSRFEMRNEAKNRSEKAHKRTTTLSANRRIANKGDGGPVDMSNMPFLPYGLQWRGKSSVTSRQFLVERDARVASKGKHGEASMESSTTGDQ